MYIQLLLALLSPLVFLIPKKGKVWFTLGLVATGAALAISTALGVLAGGDFQAAAAPHWEYSTFFGAEYAALDPLSAIFTIIICIGAVSVVLYSKGYVKGYLEEHTGPHLSLHYMALSLLFFSMLGVVACRGGYGFLICWELMTICSFVLILFDAHKPQTRGAALSYLVMMHVGFVFLLAAFVTLHSKGLPVSFDSLPAYFRSYTPIPLFLLFLVGFGMKAGMFPLHTWLPEAHPAAPSHVSAFMSGVMIKMGVYGIIRVMSSMETGIMTAGIILFVLGMVTGVWGGLLAAVQNDVKRLLAYSSIENIGIIFIATGAAFIGRHMGLSMLSVCLLGGALLHTMNHSLFKTLLFFGAGNIYTQAHTTSLESLGGLAKKMPFTAVVSLVGVIAICALPPLNGFVSEFLIYLGFFDTLAVSGNGAMVAIAGILSLSFIGGVAVLAFSKLYGVAFLGAARSEAADNVSEVDIWRKIACMVPVAGILAVGFAPFVFTDATFGAAGRIAGLGSAANVQRLLDKDIFTMAGFLVGFVAIVCALLLIRKMLLRRRTVSAGDTWGCGYGAVAPDMQYTGESFSEGLQSISPSLAGKGTADAGLGRDEIFPDEHSFRIERRDRVASLFNAWWMELLRVMNSRVMTLRTGKVNYYILYALLFLLLVLLFSIFGVI